MTTKPHRLSKLNISEISLVDRPANPHARVELAKRDGRDIARPIFNRATHGATFEGLNRAVAVLTGARSMAKGADGTAKPVALTLPISKLDEERRQISGWASVSSVNGRPVVDLQGDYVDVADLRTAAHEFITGPRHGLAMHAGKPIMRVTESLIVDDDVAAAMGIMSGIRGWWACAQVEDTDTWAKVRDGKFRALSVAGSATFSEGA